MKKVRFLPIKSKNDYLRDINSTDATFNAILSSDKIISF